MGEGRGGAGVGLEGGVLLGVDVHVGLGEVVFVNEVFLLIK